MFQDVTVLYEGAEITRGSLSQVLEVLTTARPTTSVDPQSRVVRQQGGTPQPSERETTAGAADDDNDNDDDGEQPGPAGLCISAKGEEETLNNSESDVEESIRQNNALWDVYFKT